MLVNILTLFPGIFEGSLTEGILRQAREKAVLEVDVVNVRDFAHDKHRTCDDYQYGGGSGMVMKPEPLFGAVESVSPTATGEAAVVLLSARGRLFDQALARELAGYDRMVLICGHYKGVDERVTSLATHEISIGDYVLSGGEFAAMVLLDSVVRLLPGVLGDIESAESDSFFEGILGPPTYTRPESFRGMSVPSVLISGDHERIRLWRREQALRATLERRPELLTRIELSEEDIEILERLKSESPAGAA